jgi:hypothetical protein
VWGTSATNVFAVGYAGQKLHFDGVAWRNMTPGDLEYLNGVWGTSAFDVFAVAGDEAILHYDGVRWSPMPWGTGLVLYGVGASKANDVFAVGNAGTVVHLDRAVPTLYGGACAAPIPLYCAPDLDRSVGDTTGRPADHDAYGSVVACAGARPTTGAEVFHRLDCPVTGTVTVRLTPAAADLDLVVVAADASDPQRGCDPTRCVAASQTAGLAVEEVTFASTRGTTYYAVVDGYAGAASGYALEIACAKQ